jgi:hypothetical protein
MRTHLFQVPIFTQTAAGFSGSKTGKLRSTVTVAYDEQFRIMVFAPKESGRQKDVTYWDQDSLHRALTAAGLGGQLATEPFPTTSAEASKLVSDGRPAAAGGRQAKHGRP